MADGEQQNKIRQLLDSGQKKAEKGDPAGALQDLMLVMQSLGQNRGAFQVLEKARAALAGSHPQQATEEVFDMLSRCSLGAEEVPRSDPQEQRHPSDDAVDSMDHDQGQPSSSSNPSTTKQPILQASGRDDIPQAALADGSSYVCAKCGGVVSYDRQEAHTRLWCPQKVT